MLPEGTYRGTVTGWGFEKSSGGKAFFKFDLRLTHVLVEETNEETGKPEMVFGEMETPVRRSLPLWLSNNQTAMDIMRGNLRSIGFDDPNLARLDPDHPEAHDFSGQEITVTVKHQEWGKDPTKPKKLGERLDIQRTNSKVGYDEIRAYEDAFAKAGQKKEVQEEKSKEVASGGVVAVKVKKAGRSR